MEPNSSESSFGEKVRTFFPRIKEKVRARNVSGSFFLSVFQSAQIWFQRVALIIRSFSAKEKIVFFVIILMFSISGLALLWRASSYFMVEVPARGGTMTEGVVGTPRFVNPLLALSDTDRDLTEIIYSGLTRATESGELVADLAESYEISPDGLTYTFALKEGLTWHDGKPIGSDDVIFTIQRVKDPVLRSPKRASWEGVSVQKIDERTVQFTLLQPYAPFIENTTLGILPKHAWEQIHSEQFSFSKLNIEPIGSGPYKIRSVGKSASGIPTYYNLSPFKKFALGEPYISNIRIRFYANVDEAERALERGDIEAMSAASPERAENLKKRNSRIITYALPRIFGVFFNQNQNTIFTNSAVREALYLSVDREEVVRTILNGYGTPLYGPLPPGSLGFMYNQPTNNEENFSIEKAENILEKAGWKKSEETGIRQKTINKTVQPLQFSIATSEADELKNAAYLLKETWESIGISVDIKIFKAGDLNQNVIRPRKYDALFFGEIIGRESDPFAFWHSSQRNDPGLNIALYANIATDKLLEEGRIAPTTEEREIIYQKFEKEVKKDFPFVPLYSPDFIYIVPNKIKGIIPGTITTPSERFLDVYKWHINTERVWRIFSQ